MNAQVRHVRPVPDRGAEGLVGAVYDQARSELGLLGPGLTMLSPAPELLAPVWSLLRESLLVGGPAERLRKEVVSTAIAARNRCVFCTDAHTVMMHAAGEHELAESVRRGRAPSEFADLAAWAARPSPDGPFPAEAAPRYLGTVLVFELITRLVKAMVTNASPHPVTATKLGRSVASRRLREAVAADLEPGRSLLLLDEMPNWSATSEVIEPSWAAGSPVGAAYGAVRALASNGAMLLGDQAADEVQRVVGAYGTDLGDRLPPLEAVEALPRQARLGARLAVSAALAPERVDDADVARWRGEQFSDHCVVYLLAYGAVSAVDTMQDEFKETRDADV